MLLKILTICSLITITICKPPFQGYEPKRIVDNNSEFELENNRAPKSYCKCPSSSGNNKVNKESANEDDLGEKYNYKKPNTPLSSSSPSSSLSGTSSSALSSSLPVSDDDYRPRPFSKNTESSEEHIVRKETNIVEKEFYTYSPPKDVTSIGKTESEQNIINKKKIRVLFIRAPENDGVENIATKLAKTVVEDQTHVYVLTKQIDSTQLQKAFEQNIEIKNQKPEIHFVKFRNEEEALDAQHSIQQDIDNQYSGESSNIEGGEASLQSWSTSNTETSENSSPQDDDSDIRDLLPNNNDGNNNSQIYNGNRNDENNDDDDSNNNFPGYPNNNKQIGGSNSNANFNNNLSISSQTGNNQHINSNNNKNHNNNDILNLPTRNGYLPPNRNY